MFTVINLCRIYNAGMNTESLIIVDDQCIRCFLLRAKSFNVRSFLFIALDYSLNVVQVFLNVRWMSWHSTRLLCK